MIFPGMAVHSLSRVRLFVTSWTAAGQAPLSFTISQSLLRVMSIESVMPSNHLILCRPLLLPPSVFPSIRVFSSESVLCIRWPKDWGFSHEHPGLISFRMDWLHLLAVQASLKSLLQHHSSKASILQCSAFFMVQLSHHYWKNQSIRWTKDWSFIFRISPSDEWSGLMSFRTGWFRIDSLVENHLLCIHHGSRLTEEQLSRIRLFTTPRTPGFSIHGIF